MSSARCAIKMRSREPDPKKALELLKKDLVNGPRHCFGLHQFCSPDFCTTAREQQEQTSPVSSSFTPSSSPSAENRSEKSPENLHHDADADDFRGK